MSAPRTETPTRHWRVPLLVGVLAALACSPTAGSPATDAGDDGPTRRKTSTVSSDAHTDAVGTYVYVDGGDGALTFLPAPGATAGRVPPGHGSVWLHAKGDVLVDGQGSTVRLFGVNRSGTEYQCVQGDGIFDGPSDAASIAAIKSWNANAVRVPLNEDCWLGINGVAPSMSGAAYQAAIVAYVRLLLASGVYPIVDLHWSAPGSQLATGQEPMPDADHSVAFWTDVATTFRDDANVIFELFNEPWPDNNQDTDAAWDCWQNGGTCPSIAYPVAGMQSLVDAVRSTGAGNLLLLGGVEYSNSLTQWASRKPTDPANNLAAAWHVYVENLCNDASCWNQAPAAVLASSPIVATEVGDDTCDGSFPTSVMTWLDGYQQSYLGWAWDTFGTACGLYSLVTDYQGTPNGAYGMAFQSHFAAVNGGGDGGS